MAEQDLNRSHVDAALDEVGRETVTKGVAMDCLAQARRSVQLARMPLAVKQDERFDPVAGAGLANSWNKGVGRS